MILLLSRNYKLDTTAEASWQTGTYSNPHELTFTEIDHLQLEYIRRPRRHHCVQRRRMVRGSKGRNTNVCLPHSSSTHAAVFGGDDQAILDTLLRGL
jgi:hypothetical protein